MPDKLKSRKLWLTVITGLLVYLNGLLPPDRRVPADTITAIVALVAVYLGAQGAVDFAQARVPAPPSVPDPLPAPVGTPPVFTAPPPAAAAWPAPTDTTSAGVTVPPDLRPPSAPGA